MAVVTSDLLLEGVRRDVVFEWLCDPAHHRAVVEGAFDGFVDEGPGRFRLAVRTPPRTRELVYRFDRADDSHGGRRVYVNTEGKRFRGQLSYSLRTMKPSSNTLVTLHMDYDPGAVVGALLVGAGLEASLLRCFKAALENLSRAVPRGA
jgi:hypothetical protein